MQKYSQVFVTTDFSDASKIAFSHAEMLAKELGVSLTVLYVFEDLSLREKGTFPGQAVLSASGVLNEDSEALSKRLEEFVTSNCGGAAATCKVIRSGKSPAEALTTFLAQDTSALLVISSNGRTGISRAMLGSVTEEVVRRAPCAVLVVKGK